MSDNNYLEQRGHFLGSGKPKKYGTENKEMTKFYVTLNKGDEYETMAEFTVFGDKIELDRYHEGDEVTVRFNLNGRTWTSPEQKRIFFQSLVAFSMSLVHVEPPAPPIENPPQPTIPDDDLPF